MAGFRVTAYDPHQPRYGPRLSENEWESFRPLLTALDNRGIPRRDIVKIATKNYGFRGTYSALNIRFNKWGLTTERTTSLAVQNNVASGVSLPLPSHDIGTSQIDVQSRWLGYALIRLGDGRSQTDEPIANDEPPTKDHVVRAFDETLDPVDQLNYPTSNVPVSRIPEQDGYRAVEVLGDEDTNQSSPISNAAQMNDVRESTDPEVAALSDKPGSYSIWGSGVFSTLYTGERTRSQVSSMQSSVLGSGMSSATRSFMRCFKRLQKADGVRSMLSSSILLSWASSRESQTFEAVTGLRPPLHTVEERESSEEELVIVEVGILGDVDTSNLFIDEGRPACRR